MALRARPALGAELLGSAAVELETFRILLRVALDDHAVVASRAFDAHVLVAHVVEHCLRLTLERVAPTAAAARDVAEDRTGLRVPDRRPRERVELPFRIGRVRL